MTSNPAALELVHRHIDPQTRAGQWSRTIFPRTKLLTSEFGGGPGQVFTNLPITAGIVMTAYHMPSELPARE